MGSAAYYLGFNSSIVNAIRFMEKEHPSIDFLHRDLAWAGNAPEWFLMESMTYLAYLATLLILIVKARCIKVGIDSTH